MITNVSILEGIMEIIKTFSPEYHIIGHKLSKT